MFSTIEEMLEDAVEVSFWQYYLLPIWQMLRHPIDVQQWYRQIKTQEWDEHKYEPGAPMLTRHWLKKVGDVPG